MLECDPRLSGFTATTLYLLINLIYSTITSFSISPVTILIRASQHPNLTARIASAVFSLMSVNQANY